MERCYAFGQALARIVSAMGVKTVVLAPPRLMNADAIRRNRSCCRITLTPSRMRKRGSSD